MTLGPLIIGIGLILFGIIACIDWIILEIDKKRGCQSNPQTKRNYNK